MARRTLHDPADWDDEFDDLDEFEGDIDELLERSEADLRPALLSLLAPPPDFEERMRERLAAKVQDRQDMALFSSLLGIGIETGRVVFEPRRRPA